MNKLLKTCWAMLGFTVICTSCKTRPFQEKMSLSKTEAFDGHILKSVSERTQQWIAILASEAFINLAETEDYKNLEAQRNQATKDEYKLQNEYRRIN